MWNFFFLLFWPSFGPESFRGHFWPFTDVLREIWSAVTRKFGKTADYTDVTDGFLAAADTDALLFGRQIRWASIDFAQDRPGSRPGSPSDSRPYLCYPCNPRW